MYISEYYRLDQIRNQLETVLKSHHDVDTFDQTSQVVQAACSQLAKDGLLYVRKMIQRLILFAKVNANAASRILEKISRFSWQHGEERDSLTARFAFFNRKAGLLITSKAEEASQIAISNTPVSFGTLKQHWETIVEPFISGYHESTVRRPTQSGRLLRIVQIAGFHISAHVSDEKKVRSSLSDLWTDIVRLQFEKIQRQAPEMRAGIFERDKSRRSPLDYAAEHGMDDVVSMILTNSIAECLQESLHNDLNENYECYNISPMTLALCNGHTSTAELLLSRVGGIVAARGMEGNKRLTNLARTCLEADERNALRHILRLCANFDETDESSKNLLCIATRRGMQEACKLLLEHGIDVNAVEDATGRTALCLACVIGDETLVKLLLAYDADPKIVDSRGWTAMEHAAYRGHLKIARTLDRTSEPELNRFESTASRILTTPVVETNRTSRSHIPWVRSDSGGRTFVWITLGNIDANKPRKAVQIHSRENGDSVVGSEKDAFYSISVSADDGEGVIYKTDLPMFGQTINKPWLFFTEDVNNMKLIWKLSKCFPDPDTSEEVVASGIALVSPLNSGIRPTRESLVRDMTIPLQSPTSLAFVGTVTFTYFLSTPHSPPAKLAAPQPWEFGNGIGGHRGSGKNRIDDKRLQIGENTTQSFSTAISHGASFIEFDVQLTKDFVPVIYHDFLLSETGTDSPMHTLSFEQFEYLSRAQGPRRKRGARSNSLHATDNDYLEDITERMTHTHFNKINGFKANTRGNFIHERSCTLEDIFRHVSKAVGLNIEISKAAKFLKQFKADSSLYIEYPMLFEADDWDMETLAIKTDLYVDTILDKVYQHAEGRRIVFSSFSPEICIALSTKQRSFPVFFLSKTAAPKGEVRSCCIQQAIHFAKSWGLPGIVVECTPLIKCPKLIQYIKAAGLACMSFGMLNSEPQHAQVRDSL